MTSMYSVDHYIVQASLVLNDFLFKSHVHTWDSRKPVAISHCLFFYLMNQILERSRLSVLSKYNQVLFHQREESDFTFNVTIYNLQTAFIVIIMTILNFNENADLSPNFFLCSCGLCLGDDLCSHSGWMSCWFWFWITGQTRSPFVPPSSHQYLKKKRKKKGWNRVFSIHPLGRMVISRLPWC